MSGHLIHKLKSKVDGDEQSPKRGGRVDVERIDFEWAFKVFKFTYQEPAGPPIARIAKQLSEFETFIYRELGLGCELQKASGVGYGGKRRELKSSGRYLTNRETFDYYRGANIAKTHNLHTVMQNHCLAMESVEQLATGESEDFQDDFCKFLRTIDEYFHTDAPGGQFGKPDVYDNAKLNFPNNARDSRIER